MYSAACKVACQLFNRSDSQLTFFNVLYYFVQNTTCCRLPGIFLKTVDYILSIKESYSLAEATTRHGLLSGSSRTPTSLPPPPSSNSLQGKRKYFARFHRDVEPSPWDLHCSLRRRRAQTCCSCYAVTVVTLNSSYCIVLKI